MKLSWVFLVRTTIINVFWREHRTLRYNELQHASSKGNMKNDVIVYIPAYTENCSNDLDSTMYTIASISNNEKLLQKTVIYSEILQS